MKYQIKLRNNSWEYDNSMPLGTPGGFGAVFHGWSLNGEEVAVKKLHISSASAGNRELVISEELEDKCFEHVVPFFDSGIDAESTDYFVVMAKANCSLQEQINLGAMSENESIEILMNISKGLKEVGGIVHRDLKPGNILYHENKWKLADFGIARFVENSTSANTLKDCLSPLYAAPEQWRLERVTKATDVYALGCIAYSMLTGYPPFTSGDLREQHLHKDPDRVKATPRMQQLVSLCLRKNPNIRPSIDSVLKQLEALKSSSTSHIGIAVAGAAIAAESAKLESERSGKKAQEDARKELAKEAIKSLDIILEMMFDAVEMDAPVASRISPRGIQLGDGRLRVEVCFPLLQPDAFSYSKKNIVCGARISIEQAKSQYYLGRSANLWFGEFSPGEFRWYEVPYMTIIGRKNHNHEPYGISDQSEIKDADYAAGSIMHSVQHAAPLLCIDGEHTDEFIERWLNRLAEASKNNLQHPRTLPER
jgi:serine/threonine-protein kinase